MIYTSRHPRPSCESYDFEGKVSHEAPLQRAEFVQYWRGAAFMCPDPMFDISCRGSEQEAGYGRVWQTRCLHKNPLLSVFWQVGGKTPRHANRDSDTCVLIS